MYDSRAGFGVYYRLQPRDLAALSAGKTVPIHVHATVLHRLDLGTAGYAPGNLPLDFDIVNDDGSKPDVPAEQLNRREYRGVMHEAEKPIRLRQQLHANFVRLSLVAIVLVILAGWRQWAPPASWERPMELVAAGSLLGCLVLLRRRLAKWIFGILALAWVGVMGASALYWFPSSTTQSPFAWVLMWTNEILTWFVPAFLEAIVAQALIQFVGVTAFLFFLVIWIWTKTLDLRDDCDRIRERARKALRGKRPDLYCPPAPRFSKGSVAS
jgi:hypothetical protein